MLSCSKMMLRLLIGTICFTLCSAEVSGSMPAIFKPEVMHTSRNSAVIRLEKLRPDQEKDGYVIEYGKNWHNSKTVQVSRSSTAAMISNLEPDTLYNVRVRLPDVNNGGTHPGLSVSFRTSPVVAARIGVPQNITVVPLPLYKLRVAWDLPYRALASSVVHYSLVFAPLYSPYLRKTSLLLPGHYKSFTLTYLRPDTIYKVKMAALLKSRKGPYSSWVIAQTVGQVRLDNDARQPTTKIPYHQQTENPGIIETSPSTHSTPKTRPGQMSTKRVLEQKIQTTPYQTKEQSSIRPITITTQVKESTAQKTTETSGYRTEMTEHSTQSSTQEKGVTRMLVTTGQNAESTTLPVTVPSTATLQNTTTSVPTEKKKDGTKQQTAQQTTATTLKRMTTPAPSEQEREETTPQTTQQTKATTLQSTTTPVPTEHESDRTTQQTTQQTTAATLQGTTTPAPSEHESDGTTQRTTQQTTTATLKRTTTPAPTEHERDGTTQRTKQQTTTPTLQSTTTPAPTEHERDGTTQRTKATTLQSTTTPANQSATATTSSPSQHTEQVTEKTHQKTQLTTEGTKAQTTVKLQTTTSPPPPPRKTTRKHITQPTVTTTLQTTELSTEQTIDMITHPKTERRTTRQPPKKTTKQVTEKMTQETPQQQTTQSNPEQTTQKPTSSRLQTNRVVSGTINILQPTTSSVSAVTDKQMTDSQLFESTPSPSQRNIIITPSSSTMPTLVITGTLPTTTTQDTCERLKPSMCSDIGYQTTKMTSKEGQFQMMDHVRSMWSHLTPLCQSPAKLKQFLCAASFPYCSKDLGGPFLPCRSMCMSTKKSCNMSDEGWPAEFNCSKFPDIGESAICISYGHDSAASPTSTIHVTQWSPVPPSNDPASEFTISTLTTESSSLATRNPTTAEPKPLPSHCEPLYLKACDNAGYKAVQFPNYFNQTYQNDAGVKIAKYWPLIEVKCSPLISLFLCSLYTPICTTTVTRNMLPCRSLCQQVTNDCSYFMKVYDGFGWPEGMTCEDFPDGDDGTCLNQKYLTSQGNENVIPTSPITSREAQVTIHQSSTKTILLTLPGAISVEQELPTATESSPSAAKPTSVPKESAKSTPATQPKTGENMKIIENEDSTEAITQRNEEDFMTGPSINVVNDQSPSTKSSSITSPTSPITISPPSGCEVSYLKICQGVGYDFTQFPNFFNHKHQNDAGREVHRFWPLVEIKCSPKIQLFLCSLYVPMCTKTLSSAREMTSSLTHNMLPCQSLCYQVKRECRTIMKLYGLRWPEGVECTKLPMDGEKNCIYDKTNDTNSKGLFKIAKAKNDSPKTPSTVLPVTTKCRPLPPDHPCKNHYEMASVSNASESFESTKKFIENHTSKIKDSNSASKKCLRNLEMFLCSENTPRCSNGTIFGPCRSQCKTTLRRCGAALLKKINFRVVGLKECRQFPVTRCTENKRGSKPTSKSVESF